MEIVKVRIKDQVVNISFPKIKSLADRKLRNKKLFKYKNILNKLL